MSTTSYGRLTKPWLTIARGIWLIVVGVSLVLLIIAIPVRYGQVTELAESTVPESMTQEEFLTALDEIGIGVDSYANYLVIVELVVVLISTGIALLIFWRNSDFWPAMLISLWLVTFSTNFGSTAILIEENLAVGSMVFFLDQLGWALLLPFVFLTFPDGRFVPGWSRWLGLAWIALGVFILVRDLFDIGQTGSIPEESGPQVFVWASLWIIGLAGQIYRYLRVSGPIQRQQTKWVLFGMAGTVTIIVVLLSLESFFPWQELPAGWAFLYEEIIELAVVSFGFLLIPVSMGFAMLRYRLWDIDVIIRRTLVYGLLTFLLLAIYFGAVVLLQTLFTAISEQSSPIAIVVSTLIIAALFSPLRGRVQNIIDRRFYRRKYDASQTLADFAATARDEVNLDMLMSELEEVVRGTMQPEHVTLWLRELGDR
jgi:hypothetical protein